MCPCAPVPLAVVWSGLTAPVGTPKWGGGGGGGTKSDSKT